MRSRITTRREFIRGMGRTAAVGAVAGGAGVLAAWKARSPGCDEPTRCESCKLLGRCDLPAARAELNRQHNG